MKTFRIAVLLLTTLRLSAGEFYYIAHRGEYMTLPDGADGKDRKGVVDAPEGTRPTFERVRDRQVNAVKLDVQYTADKVVVISHDSDLKRTTGQDLPIAATAYGDLKKAPFLNVGAFGDERIVTLDEALEIVKDCQLYYLDFKAYSPEMMEAVFNCFTAHGIPLERIVIATFTRKALEGAKVSHPEIRRVHHINYHEEADGTVMLNGKRYPDFAEVKAQMLAWKKELGLSGFNIPIPSKHTTPELIRELKADGCWLTLWYAHSTADATRFRDSGVDGFVTGMPSSIRAYLEGKQRK